MLHLPPKIKKIFLKSWNIKIFEVGEQSRFQLNLAKIVFCLRKATSDSRVGSSSYDLHLHIFTLCTGTGCKFWPAE